MTQADHLPNEMVTAIFENLSPKDLFSCFDVCHNWRVLVDEVLGLDLHVGDGADEIWEEENVKFRNIESISKFGTRLASFSDLGDSEITPVLPVRFKHPKLLKAIWMDGRIPPDTFNSFSKDLVNLQKLTLHVSTLSVVPLQALDLNLDSLTSLMVSKYRDQLEDDENLALVAENLVYLMNRDYVFRALTKLSLHVPFLPDEATDMTQAIVNFILLHKNTLRHVVVSLEGEGEVDVGHPAEVPGIPREDIIGTRLSSVVLHCSLPNHASMRNLRSILTGQTEAQSLYCTIGFVRFSVFRRTLRASAATLTSVQLAISCEPDGSGVDMNLLAPCKSLKVLALLGPEKEDETEDPFEEDEDEIAGQMLTPDVHHTSSLPNSLRVVKIFNLFMTCEDVRILSQKPNLRVLHLDNVGRFGNLGLALPDALEVLGSKRLKTIRWKNCINVESVEAARRGNDPNVFFCSLVVRHTHGVGFTTYFNERLGRYELGSASKEPEILPSDNPKFELGQETFTMTDEADEEDDEAEDDEDEEVDEEDEDEIADLEEDAEDEDAEDEMEVEEVDDDAEDLEVEDEEEEDADIDIDLDLVIEVEDEAQDGVEDELEVDDEEPDDEEVNSDEEDE